MGASLHPFLRQVIEWYDVVPLQLSPNSYKLILALFILYHDLKYPPPTMEEISYFYSLRKSDHSSKHVKNLKEPFFYLYDVERVGINFKTKPSNGVPLFFLLFT